MTTNNDSTETRLPPLLRQVWFNLNKTFRRRIAHLNITPDQFTTLRWISEKSTEGLIQRQLVELMSSDPNTIVSILKRLEAADLVERKQLPDDRRVYQLSLTPKGKTVLAQALPLSLDLQEEVLSLLSDKQRNDLSNSLNTLIKATEKLL